MKAKSVLYYFYPALSMIFIGLLFVLKVTLDNLLSINPFNLPITELKNVIVALQVFGVFSLIVVVVDLMIKPRRSTLFKPFFLLGAGAFTYASFSMNPVLTIINEIQSINVVSATKHSYELMSFDFTTIEVILLVGAFLVLLSLILWCVDFYHQKMA